MEATDQEPDETPIDWDALIAGYVRGDDAQANELFGYITKHHLPRIFRHLDPGLNPDQVRELVARLNNKLHAEGKLRQYHGPDKFLSWLNTLARNERADYFREIQRGATVMTVSKDDESIVSLPVDYGRVASSARHDPGEAAQEKEIMRMIAACLGRLAREDREIIERRLLDGEDYEQIAMATGITTERAHLKFFRARGRLATCLEKSGAAVKNSGNRVKDSKGKGVKA